MIIKFKDYAFFPHPTENKVPLFGKKGNNGCQNRVTEVDFWKKKYSFPTPKIRDTLKVFMWV